MNALIYFKKKQDEAYFDERGLNPKYVGKTAVGHMYSLTVSESAFCSIREIFADSLRIVDADTLMTPEQYANNFKISIDVADDVKLKKNTSAYLMKKYSGKLLEERLKTLRERRKRKKKNRSKRRQEKKSNG